MFALAMGVTSRHCRRRVTRHSTSDGSDETDGSSDRGVGSERVMRKRVMKKRRRVEEESSEDEEEKKEGDVDDVASEASEEDE